MIQYSVMDPTGNITALVESHGNGIKQSEIASVLLTRHPEVEQVGFVRYPDPENSEIDVELNMAGGEFCGNAAISAAALYLFRFYSELDDQPHTKTVKLSVSGCKTPIQVNLRKKDINTFLAGIHMPDLIEIENKSFICDNITDILPIVKLEGISHIIVEPDSLFQSLLKDRKNAEAAIKCWCQELSAECLGIMFLNQDDRGLQLIPLVYVPGAQTVFWENSCASGTAAAGMYLAKKYGEYTSITFYEPAGTLKVDSDPDNGETWLYGQTKLRGNYIIDR